MEVGMEVEMEVGMEVVMGWRRFGWRRESRMAPRR